MNTNYKYTTIHKSILGNLHTPVNTYLKVRDLFPQSVLMDSLDYYHGTGNNKSFIGLNPIAIISVNHGKSIATYPNGTTEETSVKGKESVKEAINTFLGYFGIEGEYLS